MCGIAGIWRPGAPADDRPVVASMLEELRRRGPDCGGLEREGPLTVGHRRLAIVDLSDAGRQPMASRSGRFLISFNGEIFNFAEIRDELGLTRWELRSDSDTEILLEAWERWGPETLPRLVGPFAFALYDRQERKLWIVRDRIGEKPLFYHEASGLLTFASSIGALFRAEWVGRELDEDALAEYLTLRYVVAPRTIVAGVKKLRPGHLLEIDPREVKLRRWWMPRFGAGNGDSIRPSPGEAIEQFGALFQQACERCLVSDAPVAMLLSDGIDSNAIRAALAATGTRVSAHTFRPAPAGDEVPAERIGSADDSVETSTFDPGGIHDQIDPALSGLTEPVGDGSALATWLLIRNARSRATVFLCGHGGDEVLGGYRLSQERFRLSTLRLLCRLPMFLSAPVVEYWTHGVGPVAERRRMFTGSSPDDWPAAVPYLIHRPLYHEDLDELHGGAFSGDGSLDSVLRLYGECPQGLTDLDRIQYVLLETFFAANILSFADGVSMDSSAELRMPFVDRDLVEFVLRMPRDMRVSRWPGHANTKLLLRKWARGRLPADVIQRKKRTFNYSSIRRLLREHGDSVRGRILDAPFLRRSLGGLEAWVSREPDFFHGPREGTLWALLSLAVWGRAVGLR